MSLTLVVPGLLDLSAAALPTIDSHAPALARLLVSAGPGIAEEDGTIASACRACGIVRQIDWPVAPQLARAAGFDPGEAYWLCAVPVTLAVGAADVRLGGIVEDLGQEDAEALIATLNAHFAPDRIAFTAATPSSWYVRAAEIQQLSTRPPEAALGSPLFTFLPSGRDAARWRRWQSELQMLLFEHPVNQRRERASAALVNSVWFWGGGVDAPRHDAAVIFTREAPIVELARGSGVECRALPLRFDSIPLSDATLWFDAIEAQQAAPQLDAIERAWVAPIERALSAGRVPSLELIVAGRERALRFRPRRSSLTQRWHARIFPPRCSEVLTGIAAEAVPS